MASKNGEKVTRISAKESAPKKGTKKSPKTVKVRTESTNPFLKALFAFGGYFKGAWAELRAVRWPSRRATWSLTLAVILFSAFFVVIILLLDVVFKYLFEVILK